MKLSGVPAPSAGTESDVPEIVGVRRVLVYIERVVRRNPNLRALNVRGEVSNLKAQPGGQLYFDLKEADVVLNCVAWKREAEHLPSFENGDEIVASGEVLAYIQRSRVQLVVRSVTTGGVGSVHARYEALKKKLEAEGIFSPDRKRPLPPFPFRIAIVSSRRADGGIDVESVLKRRAPHVTVLWCETSVQGPGAPLEIASAIDRASAAEVDVIIVTRGGGSFEDMIAFSQEAVVRAIVRARHPVISAVGHTVNQQLSDFAADLHAETPSAAAELVSPERSELLLDLRDDLLRIERKVRARIDRDRRALGGIERRAVFALHERLLDPHRDRLSLRERNVADAIRARLDRAGRRVASALRALEARSPSARLHVRAQRLTIAQYQLRAWPPVFAAKRRARLARCEAAIAPAFERALRRRGERLRLADVQLHARSPEEILKRGYAIVQYQGRIVRDPRLLAEGARIEATLALGTLMARVEGQPERAEPAANDLPNGDT